MYVYTYVYIYVYINQYNRLPGRLRIHTYIHDLREGEGQSTRPFKKAACHSDLIFCAAADDRLDYCASSIHRLD